MSEFRRAVTIVENNDGGFKVVFTADEADMTIKADTVIKMMHRAIDMYAGLRLTTEEGTE